MTEYSKTNLLKLAQDKQYAKMGAHLSLEDQQLILTKAQQLKENIFTFDKPWIRNVARLHTSSKHSISMRKKMMTKNGVYAQSHGLFKLPHSR